MNGGTITLTGENSTEGSENKGIKVDGDESSDGAGKGYILINDGILTSTTSGKGISAGWDIDDDATTTDTSDDPYPDVFINGGAITITTTATPREDSSSTADDGVSPEGIEGKRNVTITGGTIVLSTTDDAINVSSTSGSLLISGGTIFAESSNNDAIDSNGDMLVRYSTRPYPNGWFLSGFRAASFVPMMVMRDEDESVRLLIASLITAREPVMMPMVTFTAANTRLVTIPVIEAERMISPRSLT